MLVFKTTTSALTSLSSSGFCNSCASCVETSSSRRKAGPTNQYYPAFYKLLQNVLPGLLDYDLSTHSAIVEVE